MKAGEIVASLKLRIDEFQSGIDKATQKVDSFNKKWKDTSADFKAVGTSMAAIGTGIGIGLGGAVRTAADFEKSMSRVGALSGATEKEMKLLTDEARRLGSTTVFSASEAAEGMQYLAMAGFDTTQIIDAMGGVLDMAAAGQIGLGDAANIATNIMSGFNLEASKSGYVADVLTKTFTNSNTTLQGLGETMKYAAPAAASVGWSLEDMAAAAAKLGDVGIDASMAGTALRAAVTRLANPTDKAAKLMEQFGIKTTDANGKLLPLPEILMQMKDRFSDLSDAERAAEVQTIFGTEAMSAMLALMEDPKGLQDFANELRNAGGTAEEIANKQMDNLHGVVEELSGAFEEAQISIGNALSPALKFLANGLTNVLNWFNALPDGVKSAIAIFLALSAVLTVVGGAILIFIGFIPNIIAGFKSLSTVLSGLKLAISGVGKAFIWLFTNPVGLIILGITALIAAIVLIWQNWDTVKAKTIEIWEAIKSYLLTAWEWLKGVFQAFLDWIVNLWNTVWTAVKDFFTTVWEGIKNVGITIWNAIKEAFFAVWNAMWNFVSTILAIIYAVIATAWEGILALAKWIWGLIGDYVIGVWNGIKSAAITIWNAIKSFFTTILNAIKTVFTTVWNATKTVVTTIWNSIKSVATTIFNALKSFFTSVLNAIKSVFTTVWNAIKSVLTSIWNSIKSVATSVWNGIKSFFTSWLNSVRSVFTSIWNAIKGVLTGIWNSIKSVATSVFNSIKSVITSITNSIRSVVTSVWNGIRGTLSGIWNGIKGVASSVWNSISNTISRVTNTIRSKVSSAASFMRNTFSSAINAVKGFFSNMWNGIKGGLDKVVNGIKDKVRKAKEWLSNLNPFKRHSPSLVDNVKAGVKVIRDTYAKVSDIQIAPPHIGNLTTGRIDIESAFGGGDKGGNGGGTNYNAPLVQVENMNVRSDRDVRGISRELYNLQRNHDRARGGR